MGHRTAVGIAKNNHIRAGGQRRFHNFGCVTGIVFIAVEKMLGIKKHFFAHRFQIFDGIGNHGQIFVQVGFENFGYVQIP